MFLNDRSITTGQTYLTVRDDSDASIRCSMIGMKAATAADHVTQLAAAMLAFESLDRDDQVRAVVTHMPRFRGKALSNASHRFDIRATPEMFKRLKGWSFSRFSRAMVLRAAMLTWLALPLAEREEWINEAYIFLGDPRQTAVPA